MENNAPQSRPRLPQWLKKRLPLGPEVAAVREVVDSLGLSTVCSSAHCPNMCDCFSRRAATFMILGDTCTRSCGFCAVKHGVPSTPRQDEPDAVAQAAERLGLRHVVVTCVTRDDLPDGGAGHFARTIAATRGRLSDATVEVLTSDFGGSEPSIRTVLSARPDVFNHNIETVECLTATVRPQAEYRRSLRVLETARSIADSSIADCGLRIADPRARRVLVKSGLMVGLGETADEIRETLKDLRAAGVEIVTIGQYLSPSKRHLPVARYVEPAEFEQINREALAMGFVAVAAGPFVRSSYNAEALLATPAAVSPGFPGVPSRD